MAGRKQTGAEYVDMFHSTGLHLPTRTISLLRTDIYNGDGDDPGVDHVLANRFITNLHCLESMGSEEITVLLNTPGGDETQGMAIYDAISLCKSRVRIIGIGQVCSMGTYILQAGDERLLYPHCIVMFHTGTSSTGGEVHRNITEKWFKFDKKYSKKIDAILKVALREKDPELTDYRFDQMNHFDTILTAEEAVSLGLADGII